MRRLCLLFAAIPICLFPELRDLSSEGSDLALRNHVNVITGKLHLYSQDHVVKGAVPLCLQRTYSNHISKKDKNTKCQFSNGWNLFSHTHLILKPKGKKYEAEILESSGQLFKYIEVDRDNQTIYLTPQKRHQNSFNMSYRSNPMNNRLEVNRKTKKAILYLADGGKRIYELWKKQSGRIGGLFGLHKGLGSYYLLRSECSSSGQKTVFIYSDYNHRITVKSVSPDESKVFSQICLHQTGENSSFRINAGCSDKVSFNYYGKKIKDVNYLDSVSCNIHLPQKIHYARSTNYIEDIVYPGRQVLRVQYFETLGQLQDLYKVRCILKGGEKVATFSYSTEYTDVRDHNNVLTRYYHKDGALTRIESFDKEDNLYSANLFMWKDGNLVAQIFCDGNLNPISSRTFKYDKYQNVIEETVYGNLTGQSKDPFSITENGVLEGAESYTKCYRYNEKLLCIEEKEENGLTYQFEYKDNTDLITSKRVICNDKFFSEETYVYDDDLLLIQKSSFDGYRRNTEQYTRDPKNGMVIATNNGFYTTYFGYNERNDLIKEENEFASILMDYDNSGRLIKKVFPLKGENNYTYDDWGNRVEIKEVGSPLKLITYDKDNHPISCLINGKASKSFYNKQGLVIANIDRKGCIKEFEYDEFGRLTKETIPSELNETNYEYDVCGNIISETTPGGAVTRTSYNSFNKPIEIIFPDGCSVCHSYYKTGELKETVEQDGGRTFYEYDPLKRMTLKQKGSFKERWEYEGASLKSYIDAAGLTTIYEYDEFGRKIAEVFEGRRKDFIYDEVGNICEVREGELYTREVFDIEGRVIEVSQNGFHKMRYEYDDEGRKTKAIKLTSKGEAIDQFFYDEENRIILHIDPLNQETKFLYEDFAKITIDPLGNKVIERYDNLSRVIEKQKQSLTGKVLLSEKFFYDREGNLKKRYTEDHDIDVVFHYDQMGRLVEEVESGKKHTQSQYDVKGRLSTKTLPNGVCIDYEYDEFDRMTKMKSSDGTVWYEYIYSDLNLIEVKDHIAEKSVKRSYTKYGELTEEIGFSGFKTSWYYDTFGRKKETNLPDGSSIHYDYQKNCLEKVSRFDKEGQFLYEHKYTKFDPNQHVEEEKLPFNLGSMQTHRDLIERPYKVTSKYHKLELEFGATNLVTKQTNTLTGNKDYKYDDLSQLTKEGDKTYDFDSLGNPKENEVNDLNQIVSGPDELFSYDKNGNLRERKHAKYFYDALNRLTKISYKAEKIVFTYDPFSRLVSKEVYVDNEQKSKKYYLYDQECEIGTINEAGDIEELKVLGLGVQGDIGAAIALELKGKNYIPVHDLQGNIIAILDENGLIVEKYNFNAFGEEAASDYINPWRFSSKRHEENLIFFGFRFYVPDLKRWISPDPLGFVDSRNLYLYVLNSPLNRLDQFGLSASNSFPQMFFPTPNEDVREGVVFSSGGITTNPYPFTHSNYAMPVKHFGFGDIGGIEQQFIFICSRNIKLTHTTQEYDSGRYNFFDKLGQLVQGAKPGQVAMTLYHNGINNTFDDCHSSINSFGHELPQGTLIGGVYNQSNGIVSDLMRAISGVKGQQNQNSKNLGNVLMHVMDIVEKHASQSKIALMVHSEGAANYVRAYENMPDEYRKKATKCLMVHAFGPAILVPKEFASSAINYISIRDFMASNVKPWPGMHYERRILEAKTHRYKGTCLWFDHNLGDPTYSEARRGVISKIQKGKGFYVGNQR